MSESLKDLEALAEKMEIHLTALKVIQEHLDELQEKIKVIEDLAGELNGWASSSARNNNDRLWRNFRRSSYRHNS